ncbi:MAG: histidine phosphatase family protein [Candidatus Peribacteria bacterium]|jgi:phosphohistidine phosphatase SixA|nr:histidine phosphatase family protein [Candidatus Peribacteria bacterium]
MAKYCPIIIVRHGAYGSDDRLSEVGKEQIVALATKLKKAFSSKPQWFDESAILGETTLLFSSTAPRAKDSAEVLQKELGLSSLSLDENLWSDKKHPFTPAKIKALKDKIDAFFAGEEKKLIIIVSHLEFTNEFCEKAGHFYSSTPDWQRKFHCEYGEGILTWLSNHGPTSTSLNDYFSRTILQK